MKNDYGKQEADQYIESIYLPVMVNRRVNVILDDYYNEQLLANLVLEGNLNDEFMGFGSKAELCLAAGVEERKLLPKNMILGTIDGERNGSNTLKRLYRNESIHINKYNQSSSSSSSSSPSSATLLDDVEAAAVMLEEEDPAECFEKWQEKISHSNIEIMKHSASCSKIEQHGDVVRSGFMGIHQFLNGDQVKHFDYDVGNLFIRNI